MVEGLRAAAQLAREQAQMYLTTYLADDARVLEAFAASLERRAASIEAKLEDVPTDPDVTVVSVRCRRCGLDALVPRGFA